MLQRMKPKYLDSLGVNYFANLRDASNRDIQISNNLRTIKANQ